MLNDIWKHSLGKFQGSVVHHCVYSQQYCLVQLNICYKGRSHNKCSCYDKIIFKRISAVSTWTLTSSKSRDISEI